MFAMFVTMALVTTFLTTPLTLAFYPLSYRTEQTQLEATIKAEDAYVANREGEEKRCDRFTVVLDRFDHLPALFNLAKIIQPPFALDVTSIEEKDSHVVASTRKTTIDAIRLIELSDRTSALIKASESPASLLASDTLSSIFRSFASSAGIPTTTKISVAPIEGFGSIVASHAVTVGADWIVVPWSVGGEKEKEREREGLAGWLPNPLESVLGRGAGREGSWQYAAFVRKVFAEGEFTALHGFKCEDTDAMRCMNSEMRSWTLYRPWSFRSSLPSYPIIPRLPRRTRRSVMRFPPHSSRTTSSRSERQSRSYRSYARNHEFGSFAFGIRTGEWEFGRRIVGERRGGGRRSERTFG